MQKIEIRFSPDRQLEETRIQNVTVEICEKVLEPGSEAACLQKKGAPQVIVCDVRNASRAWSAIQDCLEDRGLISYVTVFIQMEKNGSLTQIYPLS